MKNINKNANKIILDLCGGTGSWSKPYRDAGYNVRVITLPDWNITLWNCIDMPLDRGEQGKYAEFREFLRGGNIHGILAAPPCTMFSFARTTAKKPRDFYEGMKPVQACMEIIWEVRKNNKLAFWAIENPMGYLRQFLGNPAFTFDPSQFGEKYNKTTDLWGYFKPPKRKKRVRYDSTDDNTRELPEIPAEYKKDYHMSNLQIRRSISPEGFAKAFFKANP